MIDRRKFLGIAAGSGASLVLTPGLLRALQPPGAPPELLHLLQQSQGQLIQRAIPSTGEMLPVVSFDPRKESDAAGMKEILRTLLDNGGKVIDFPHGGGEDVAWRAASELGIQERLFWTMPIQVPPADSGMVLPGAVRRVEPAAVRAALEEKLAKFAVPRFDLVMVSASANVTTCVAVLTEMKKEGKVRYIGVHELTPPPYPTPAPLGRLASIMRNEPIDFVGTDYSAGWRDVEERILPLAQERKIGFMAHFTFDRGRLFERASGTRLPEWAAEFDARTWAQFFIKYVVSHPAVSVARVGTTNPAHMLDNLGGGIGRLPNEATRRRMAELVDALPPRATPPAAVRAYEQQQQLEANLAPTVALSAAVLDRYVGEYEHVAAGTIATIRRDGEKLLVNVQGSGRPELAFAARSETHFAAATIFTLEFQLDGQGKVTGATWVATLGAPERIPLMRK